MSTAKAQQDFWKNFADFKAPAFDFNSVLNSQKRNIEAISAFNQVVVESTQAASKQQAEAVRKNVESLMNATKDIMTSNSPENNTAKQMDLVKDWYEDSIKNARNIAELVTKSSNEAFEIINKRAAESWEEVNKAAGKK